MKSGSKHRFTPSTVAFATSNARLAHAASFQVENHKTWEASVVYGDTDSLFIELPGRSLEEAHRIGKEMANTVSRMCPPDVVLKFEKVGGGVVVVVVVVVVAVVVFVCVVVVVVVVFVVVAAVVALCCCLMLLSLLPLLSLPLLCVGVIVFVFVVVVVVDVVIC